MLTRTTSLLSRRVARSIALRSAAARSMSSEPQAPSSFSHDKMTSDKRYQGDSAVPESLLQDAGTGEFSIRGQFREGRAAYLDMSATTPLDPRVLDAMAPYMVCETISIPVECLVTSCLILSILFLFIFDTSDWIIWKSSQPYSRLWLGSRACGRTFAGTSRQLDWGQSQGDYFYEWSNGIKQSIHQRSGSLLQETRQARHYNTDRAQVCIGFVSVVGNGRI